VLGPEDGFKHMTEICDEKKISIHQWKGMEKRGGASYLPKKRKKLASPSHPEQKKKEKGPTECASHRFQIKRTNGA